MCPGRFCGTKGGRLPALKPASQRQPPELAAVGANLGKIEPLRGLLQSGTSETARGTASLCGVGKRYESWLFPRLSSAAYARRRFPSIASRKSLLILVW